MAELQVIPRVLDLLDSACAKQFEVVGSYIKGSETDLSTLTTLDGNVTVSIGASSDDLSLQLYLSVPSIFLRETMPSIEVQNSDMVQYQEDWCMELANRFMGRLKNKLVSHLCVLRMGLPKLIPDAGLDLGLDLGQGLEPGAEIHDRIYLVDSHLLGPVHDIPVVCRLLVKPLNEAFQLSDYEDEDEDWFDESELEHL